MISRKLTLHVAMYQVSVNLLAAKLSSDGSAVQSSRSYLPRACKNLLMRMMTALWHVFTSNPVLPIDEPLLTSSARGSHLHASRLPSVTLSRVSGSIQNVDTSPQALLDSVPSGTPLLVESRNDPLASRSPTL